MLVEIVEVYYCNMNAFNYNVKLIRSLTGKTQTKFAKLIKTNPSNIKTWENTSTQPTDVLIYNTFAELAGVTVEDIRNKTLTPKDINLNVEEVDDEDEDFSISKKEYIDELREDKKRAAIREDKIMGQLAANLTAMMQLLGALSRHDRAFHETMLKSLERLEKRKENELVAEARSFEAVKQLEEQTGGK